MQSRLATEHSQPSSAHLRAGARAAASFISQIYTAPSISDSGTAGGKLDKHNIPLQFESMKYTMGNFIPRAQQVLCGGGVASRRRSLQMVHKTTTATRFGDGANRTIKVQVPTLTCHISHYFPTSGRRPGMPYKPAILHPTSCYLTKF